MVTSFSDERDENPVGSKECRLLYPHSFKLVSFEEGKYIVDGYVYKPVNDIVLNKRRMSLTRKVKWMRHVIDEMHERIVQMTVDQNEWVDMNIDPFKASQDREEMMFQVELMEMICTNFDRLLESMDELIETCK